MITEEDIQKADPFYNVCQHVKKYVAETEVTAENFKSLILMMERVIISLPVTNPSREYLTDLQIKFIQEHAHKVDYKVRVEQNGRLVYDNGKPVTESKDGYEN